MAFDDLVNKGKEALNSEQGENISDQAIQGGGDFVDNATGGKFSEQIDGGQEAADNFLGQSGAESGDKGADQQ